MLTVVKRKFRESKQSQDCNEKTAQTQPRQMKQNQNVLENSKLHPKAEASKRTAKMTKTY